MPHPQPGSRIPVSIEPDQAVLVVVLPAEGEARFSHDRLSIGSTIADSGVSKLPVTVRHDTVGSHLMQPLET